MFTTAEDWVDRLLRAGGRIRLDGKTMYPLGDPTPEQDAIWREIRGQDNPHWQPVESLVRALAGEFLGFTDYPPA